MVDLAGWLQTMGAANDSASRPDGFHLSTAAADQFTRNVLGPQLLELTGVTAPPTAVSAVEAKCAAVGGFVLGEVVANNALPKSRPDREQAFADLQKNGATLQRQEPSLAAAVEAREKWWSAMLGLDKPNGQPAAKAVETPDAASAGARVKAYQQQNCR